MGVAVMDNKCGVTSFLVTNFCLWAVPNLCCSSTITNARCLNLTLFWISACVPMRTAISPDATHFKSCEREMSVQPFGLILDGNLRQPLPVMRPMFMGRCEKYFMKDSK